MKKTSLLLATLLAVALAACGKKDEPAPAAAPAPAVQPAAPVQEAATQPAEEAAEAVEEAAEAAAEEAAASTEAVVEQTTTALDAAVDKAREAAEAAVEAGKELAEEAKANVEAAVEEARGSAAAAVAAVAQAISPAGPAPLSAADAENLAKAKGCMACHATDRKLVGPSYKEVAEKRAGEADAVTVIAAKIRQGGSGVYGPVPMPPHPQVSEVEAAQLAQWVLSLR